MAPPSWSRGRAAELAEAWLLLGLARAAGPLLDRSLNAVYLPAYVRTSPPPERGGPAATASRPYRYTETPSPGGYKAALGRAALALACRELGLVGASLKWFGRALPNDAVAFATGASTVGRSKPHGAEVWLRRTLGPEELIRTAAHEARHVWQMLASWRGTDRAAEGDADQYAAAFWAKHGSRLMAQAAAV